MLAARRFGTWAGCRLATVAQREFAARTPAALCSKDSSLDPLDDIFSELDGVLTSSGVKQPAAKSQAPAPTPDAPADMVPSGAPSEGGGAAKSTKAALQKALQEAREEEQQLITEHGRERRARGIESYRPTAPARTFLSTGEMIANKAPQHFVPCETEPAGVPELTSSGSAAVVSLVGKVTSQSREYGTFSDGAGGEASQTFDLAVEYTVPFAPSRTTEVLVRCVGFTLASFAREHVHVGDIVHVLGHLVPVTEDGTPCAQVYALPLGGNVSVVARLQQ